MILSVIFFCCLIWQLKKTISLQRKWLIGITGLLYLAVTLFDLLYLNITYQRAFHFSDAGGYYYHTLGMSFSDVWHVESSNMVYWLINWVYNHLYTSPSWISFLLRINNILVLLSAYAMLTKKIPRISYVDILMLWNPMMVMVVIRNVRDLYILFFVVVLLIGFGLIRNNSLPKSATVLGILMVLLFRSVLLLPVAAAVWMKYKYCFSARTRYIFYAVGAVFLSFSFARVVSLAGGQIVSALQYINEDISMYTPLLQGVISPGLVIMLIKRMAIALISFIFTPQPLNYILDWVQNMDHTGMANIYTGFDNLLIFFGSIVNYLWVFPILFACVGSYRHLNKYVSVYTLLYIALYVTMYIGVSDIRNRIHALFFVQFLFLTVTPEIRVRPVHYLLSAGMFFAISLFSQ